MMESLRNLQESYNADFLLGFERLTRTLDRIDRRLARHMRLPGGRKGGGK